MYGQPLYYFHFFFVCLKFFIIKRWRNIQLEEFPINTTESIHVFAHMPYRTQQTEWKKAQTQKNKGQLNGQVQQNVRWCKTNGRVVTDFADAVSKKESSEADWSTLQPRNTALEFQHQGLQTSGGAGEDELAVCLEAVRASGCLCPTWSETEGFFSRQTQSERDCGLPGSWDSWRRMKGQSAYCPASLPSPLSLLSL